MTKIHFQSDQRQTIDLGDGLVMRWSTRADATNVATLVAEAFRWLPLGRVLPQDKIPGLNEVMRAGANRLLSGNSPVMSEHDYALVEDTQRAEGKNPIVACLSLHRTPGYYGSVKLFYGKPELIATDPEYRNRGFIRKLFADMVHPESEARGDILQYIPGIRHFYRQFGYEYGLTFASTSNKIENLDSLPALEASSKEPFTLRPATLEDIPYLLTLTTPEKMHANAGVGLYYTAEYWKYTVHDLLQEPKSEHDGDRDTRIIVDATTGDDVGVSVMSHSFFGPKLEVLVLDEKVSYSDALYPVLRQIAALTKSRVRAGKEAADAKPVSLSFNLHRRHPALQLLGSKASAGPNTPPFRLYTRIPSYPKFIMAVAPELEKRLAQSAMAGVSGRLRLDFFRKVEGSSGPGLEVVFEKGKIVSAEDWRKQSNEQALEEKLAWKAQGHVPVLFEGYFAPLTFTSLLVGKCTLDELLWAYGENAVIGDSARLLLETLFPKVDHHFDIFYW